MDKLPVEILNHIFGYINEFDMPVMKLVSHQFYDIATQKQFTRNEIIRITNKINTHNIWSNFLKRRNIYSVMFSRYDFHLFHFEMSLFQHVETLEINESKLGLNDYFNLLQGLPNLKKLIIKNCKSLLAYTTTKRIPCYKSPSITELQIINIENLTDLEVYYYFTSCPNLTKFTLSRLDMLQHTAIYKRFYPPHNQQPKDSILTFYFVSKMIKKLAQTIKEIEITNTKIMDNMILEILACKGLDLVKLNLSGCTELTHISVRKITDYQRNLKVLYFPPAAFSYDLDLSFLANLPKLKELSLADCRFFAFSRTQTANFPQLRYLNICRSNVGENMLKSIINASPSLETLIAEGAPLSEEMLQIITTRLTKLRHLSLFRCNYLNDMILTNIKTYLTKLNTLYVTMSSGRYYLLNNLEHIHTLCLHYIMNKEHQVTENPLCFPNLRRLEMRRFPGVSEDWIHATLGNCPYIEQLIITKNVQYEKFTPIFIGRLPRLKMLTINNVCVLV